MEFGQHLLNVLSTTIFAYLLFDAMITIDFNGIFTRINLLGFLIPHSTKIAIWSAFALFWLRPRFGWRFPFALVMLYAVAEMITNIIWVGIHQTIISLPGTFILVSIFFCGCIIMGGFVLGNLYHIKWDWALLPWLTIVIFWMAIGYNTDSTIPYPSYFVEFLEFSWNATFLFAVMGMMRPVGVQRHNPGV